MKLNDKVIIITGGASGIGRAMAEAFSREDPKAVIITDIDGSVTDVAGEIGSSVHGYVLDVTSEKDTVDIIRKVRQEFGEVDLFCANAGIGTAGGPELSNNVWSHVLDVNFTSHLYASRELLPGWLERGGGYFLTTASAAGLLTQIGSGPYAVSKHAAVAYAEWLAVTYGDQGLKVSCLCPLGVRTGMLNDNAGPKFLLKDSISAEDVAKSVVESIAEERFLILPHPEVAKMVESKAAGHDRWIRGMRLMQKKITREQWL